MSSLRQKSIRFLVTLAALFGWACGTQAQVQPRDVKEALAGVRTGQIVPPPTEEERNAYECVVSGALNGRQLKSGHLEVKRVGKRMLLKKGTTVCCRSDEAVFAVQKSKDGSSWVLLKYVQSDLDAAWRKQIGPDLPMVEPHQVLNEMWDTLSMLDDPEFQPLRARTVAGGRVEIDYTYKLPANDTGVRIPATGTLTAAPDLKWAVTKATCRVEQGPLGFPVALVLTRDVEKVNEGIRVKSVTLQNQNGETNAVLNSTTYTFKPLPADSVNPEEFTLVYYNISPPAFDTYEDRPGFDWPLWGGIGLGFIALSVVTAWVVRRKRRNA